jgi:hypothetical protein
MIAHYYSAFQNFIIIDHQPFGERIFIVLQNSYDRVFKHGAIGDF